MRKTLSILISVLMIASLFAVGVNAAEGTAINTADEFMVMAADGTYYLNADITLTATFDTEFTGTLDGNGHTVTVSAPMFRQMNGTVKNLTTVGEIKIDSTSNTQVGAVAGSCKGGTFENVTNKANITVTTTDTSLEFDVGGIAGRLNGHKEAPHAAIFTNCTNEGNVTAHGKVGGIVGGSYDGDALFDGCVNNGNITNPSGIKNGFAAGGIYGYNGSAAVIVKNCVNNGEIVSALHAGGIAGDARKSATFENCTNNGAVKLSSTKKSDYAAAAGGMTAFAFDSGATVPLTFTNCVNNADVTAYIPGSADGVAGGMVGYTQKNGTIQIILKNCLNNGNVTAGNQAGGIVGYLYGSGDTYANIDGCISNGTISAAQYASHFLGYSNQNSTIIVNSIGNGELKALTEADKTPRLAIVCLSSGDIAEYTIENLFLADNGTTELLSWATSDDNAKNRIALTEVLGKDLAGTTITDYEGNTRGLIEASNVKAVTRGELNADLIAKANAAVGSELFALQDGKVLFASMVTEPEAPVTEPETPATEPTTPPTTDPEAPATEPTAPSTGDNAIVIVAAVAMVSILGVCLIGKKKVTE